MSSFYINAKHKKTGEIHRVLCIDDYFGKHKYGYQVGDGFAITQSMFDAQYEPLGEENENH